MDDSTRISSIHLFPMDGVKLAKFLHQGWQPFCGQPPLEQGPDVITDRRNIVYSLADGIHIEHGASGEKRHLLALRLHIGKQTEHILLVHAGRIIVGDRSATNEIVTHTGLLLPGGRRRANGNLTVDLTGIGIDDGHMVVLGHPQCQFCLADTRRTRDDDERK